MVQGENNGKGSVESSEVVIKYDQKKLSIAAFLRQPARPTEGRSASETEVFTVRAEFFDSPDTVYLCRSLGALLLPEIQRLGFLHRHYSEGVESE